MTATLNPMVYTRCGFWWRYNVCMGNVPMVDMGRVYYVVDDFGTMVMVDERRLAVSIR